MILRSIELTQFRSHEKASFVFDEQLTIITGKNGIGKTNVLEGVYVLLRGSSFRSVTDGELTTFNKPWWRLVGLVDESPREVRYQPEKRPAKHLIMNDTEKRFTYKDRLPVVLFEPNDLLLIHGSPSRRRLTFDDMLVSLSYDYKLALGRYERSLKQRNNVLKQYGYSPGLSDALFVWDVALSEYGENIIRQRRELVKKLNKLLPVHYSHIAGKAADIALKYESSLPINLSSSGFIDALHKSVQYDKVRATTSVGSHRDDFIFRLNGSDAKLSASRGETRSLLLALKLSYAQLLEAQYGLMPVMLFDDVFSELDVERQANLLSKLTKNQTIITDTKEVQTKHGKQIKL